MGGAGGGGVGVSVGMGGGWWRGLVTKTVSINYKV